ncbi:MAG: hypothetical protein WAK19_02755, partial [Candidatus Cybelea sp.]
SEAFLLAVDREQPIIASCVTATPIVAALIKRRRSTVNGSEVQLSVVTELLSEEILQHVNSPES